MFNQSDCHGCHPICVMLAVKLWHKTRTDWQVRFRAGVCHLWRKRTLSNSDWIHPAITSIIIKKLLSASSRIPPMSSSKWHHHLQMAKLCPMRKQRHHDFWAAVHNMTLFRQSFVYFIYFIFIPGCFTWYISTNFLFNFQIGTVKSRSIGHSIKFFRGGGGGGGGGGA